MDLLRDAGYPLLADSLQSEIDAPEKQRANRRIRPGEAEGQSEAGGAAEGGSSP